TSDSGGSIGVHRRSAEAQLSGCVLPVFPPARTSIRAGRMVPGPCPSPEPGPLKLTSVIPSNAEQQAMCDGHLCAGAVEGFRPRWLALWSGPGLDNRCSKSRVL